MTIGEKVDKILVIVSGLEPMVKDHHTILNGNGKDGMVTDVALLKERQDNCSARISTTIDGKKASTLNITMTIMILALLIDIALRIYGK